jgi:Zn finger protein HypA/HybF involved in hydrogenase expression
MKTVNAAQTVGNAIDPKHEIEVLCGNCGYDVNEAELDADTCSDCGEALNLRQNTKIYATSIPAAGGSTLV